MHRRLIETARQLAEADPGRPRQSMLRRAVSTAYYAVFHGVCQLAADTLAGKTAPYSDWSPIYRSIDHGLLRTVRDADLKASKLGPNVHRALRLAIELQHERNEADYNPEPLNLGRVAVRDRIGSAETALNALDALDPAERRAFAVALIARSRRK